MGSGGLHAALPPRRLPPPLLSAQRVDVSLGTGSASTASGERGERSEPREALEIKKAKKKIAKEGKRGARLLCWCLLSLLGPFFPLLALGVAFYSCLLLLSIASLLPMLAH